MAIVTKPVARILVTSEQFAEYQRLWGAHQLVTAQRDALRDALAAAIRRERAVGGYCTHEDQQARRDAEALVVEAGGKV